MYTVCLRGVAREELVRLVGLNKLKVQPVLSQMYNV